MRRCGIAQVAMVFAASALALALAGCNTVGEPELASPAYPPETSTVKDVAYVKYYPSDEPFRLGLEHFNRGNYGIAQRYFQDAVEKTPRDANAWVALAACYDRLSRFDLADRAYSEAIRLAGVTTEILNNQGYSYMLRGNFVKARKKFMQAYKREPDNPKIANNLQLLNSSRRFVKRPYN